MRRSEESNSLDTLNQLGCIGSVPSFALSSTQKLFDDEPAKAVPDQD
jgi:hypothetical protein